MDEGDQVYCRALLTKATIKKVKKDLQNATNKGLISSMYKELLEISKKSTRDTMGKWKENELQKIWPVNTKKVFRLTSLVITEMHASL